MSKKIKELQSQRSELLNKAHEIVAQATDEKPLTAEQITEAEKFTAEAEALDADIQAENERVEKANSLTAKITALKAAPLNATTRLISNLGSLNAGLWSGQDTAKVYNLPRNVRRTPVVNFRSEDDGMDKTVRAFRFGMWAMAMIGRTMPQARQTATIQAERYCMGNGLILNAAHGEGGADTTGSHVLVPDEFGTDLILLREQYGVARRLFNNVTMSSETRTEPRQLSGLTAYFVGESSAITESTMSFDNVTLVAKKVGAIARLSNELNADSAISFGDKLVGEIAYAFAEKEDDCAFNGTGTSTYGNIVGLRTRLDELTAGTAPGLISGAGNLWSELTLANFQSVVGALPQYADRPGTAWVCHKTFAHTVMQRLALAAGGATAMEIVNGVPVMMFLGYPVIVSQKYPSVEGNSQIPVTFGAHSLAAMFGNRGMEQISFSDQATVGGESMWERDQIAVRGTERIDIVVHDYGSNSTAGPVVGLETAGS